MSGAIKVVVAEDNPIFVAGLVEIIGADPRAQVVGTAGDLNGVVDVVNQHDADVVVTDLRMPPGLSSEGLEVARWAARTRPDMAVIVLSQFADVTVAADLLDGNPRGRGYLLKDRIADPAELCEAVAQVHDGGTVVDPELVDRLMNRPVAKDPLEDLTPGEREVLGLVAQGMSNRRIAEHLGVTVSAVEKRLNTLFTKLPLGDRGDTNRRVGATLLYLARRDPVQA